MKENEKRLRDLLQRSVMTVGCAVFVLAFVTAVYLSNRNFKDQEIYQKQAIQNTLTELLLPALSISDYNEVKRIIGTVNKQNDVYAIITHQGDTLLSDYSQLPLIEQAFNLKLPDVTCANLKTGNIQIKAKSFRTICNNIIYKNTLDGSEKNYGILTAFYPADAMSLSGSVLAQLLLFAAATLLAAMLILRKILGMRFLKPLEDLVTTVKAQATNPLNNESLLKNVNPVYEEISDLKTAYEELITSFRHEHSRRLEADKHAIIVATAQQVAHDIRSPLAALDMAISQLKNSPEDLRILIRSAARRINDIVNDLSASKKSTHGVTGVGTGAETYCTHLLSGLVDSLVSEKRLQFRSRTGLEIDSDLGSAAYGLFADIKAVEFKRVLSNLINNAAEGISGAGKITARLFSEGERIVLKITDTGKGIPADVLPKLMSRGETHGKSGGSGLGLYHARTSVEKWGGAIDIDSSVGVGTTVTITLPRVTAPDWFVPEIKISSGAAVVVIDDDDSIHQIWRGRFDVLAESNVTLAHFSSPQEFISWHRDNGVSHAETMFLCDYEFLGAAKNGIDVIRECGIQGRTILVTSRFDEGHVRKSCAELGVPLLPKNLAGFVPVILTKSGSDCGDSAQGQASPDAILIDDDDLVHMNWKMTAKRKNKILRVYSKPEEFWQEAPQFAKDVPIYVDSNLGDDVKGEDVTWLMEKKGFENLFIATGTNASEFGDLPWIKKIVGKAPPWAE